MGAFSVGRAGGIRSVTRTPGTGCAKRGGLESQRQPKQPKTCGFAANGCSRVTPIRARSLRANRSFQEKGTIRRYGRIRRWSRRRCPVRRRSGTAGMTQSSAAGVIDVAAVGDCRAVTQALCQPLAASHEPTERYAAITDEKTSVSIAAISMSRPVRAQ